MDIKELRKEIDTIDEEIVKLFSKRMHVSEAIGRYKIENNLKVLDISREVEKLEAVRSIAEEGYEDEIEELFKGIMAISRKRQQILINEREEK